MILNLLNYLYIFTFLFSKKILIIVFDISYQIRYVIIEFLTSSNISKNSNICQCIRNYKKFVDSNKFIVICSSYNQLYKKYFKYESY